MNEKLAAELKRIIAGSDETMSDELAEAIGADDDLLREWEQYMRTDKIGVILDRALNEET